VPSPSWIQLSRNFASDRDLQAAARVHRRFLRRQSSRIAGGLLRPAQLRRSARDPWRRRLIGPMSLRRSGWRRSLQRARRPQLQAPHAPASSATSPRLDVPSSKSTLRCISALINSTTTNKNKQFQFHLLFHELQLLLNCQVLLLPCWTPLHDPTLVLDLHRTWVYKLKKT
jgi:hypothetical protein